MDSELTNQNIPTRPQPPAANGKRRRDESQRQDIVYPRKRAITACRLCRYRKVKCNNQRPTCSACADSNAPCVYEDSEDHSVFDPASLKILERLDQVLLRLDGLDAGANGAAAERLVAPLPDKLPLQREEPDEVWIPNTRTSVEAILGWPAFSEEPNPNSMLDTIYEAELEHAGCSMSTTPLRASMKLAGIVQDDIPTLVKRFVEFVHLKNPVVDVETLWSYTQHIAEDGIDWSTSSCLVLLACALGSIAQSFTAKNHTDVSYQRSSLDEQAEELASAAAYYNLARRRFGLLERGIMAPQCYFLAGVYLMYTLKPLQAWSKLQQASQSFHMYLACQKRRHTSPGENEAQQAKRHLLEQRIYWSCYKAECELRAEFDLPSGPLSATEIPGLHPTAPDFLVRTEMADDSPEFVESPVSTASRRVQDSRAHLEASWFYYLTEITLRRMENQILRLFYVNYHSDWIDQNIPSMIEAAMEIEQQLELCVEQLPPALRQSDNEELSSMIWARIFECKLWLSRPFLYYAIHTPPHVARNWNIAQPFVDKAISLCIRGIKQSPNSHRHHGTFFELRTSHALALCVIAAARCPALDGRVPLDWQETIRDALSRMRYWREECAGVQQAVETLERILQ